MFRFFKRKKEQPASQQESVLPKDNQVVEDNKEGISEDQVATSSMPVKERQLPQMPELAKEQNANEATPKKEELAEKKEEKHEKEDLKETKKKSLTAKLKSGLSKSSKHLTGGIAAIFTQRKLDSQTLEELEDLFIGADLGVETASNIISSLSQEKYNKQITPEEIQKVVIDALQVLLIPAEKQIAIDESLKPHIILFCGVNGSGKTTTIGKYAKLLHDQGKTVVLAACDTFRAAAVEQLAVWAERASATLVTGKEQSDPASVAYQAIEQAKAQQADVLLIDTAGRLQNKKDLMEQLGKIVRVIQKHDASAPHHSIIVLDATTGQNAISQTQAFHKMVKIDGIIMTKLDGTAKGGILVNIVQQFKLPVYSIGVGEALEDLHAFDARQFAQSIVDCH